MLKSVSIHFFLITIAAAAIQLKILLSWRLPFFKGLFWTCKTVIFLNSNEFYYFFVSVPLLCLLFSAQIFFGDYYLELTVRSFNWMLKCYNFSSMCFLSFWVNIICTFNISVNRQFIRRMYYFHSWFNIGI